MSEEERDGRLLTAFDVGRVPDYGRLVQHFGATPLTPELVFRFEQVTGRKAHRFLRRGIAMSHRDLDRILDLKQQGKPFYLYTGRGASTKSMHLGHLVPFELTRYLQEALQIPVVVQMTDDEKFLFKDNLTLEQIRAMTLENIRDILAVGFDPEQTFVFLNTEYIQHLYPSVCRMQKLLPIHKLKSMFGFTDQDSCGKFAFPAVQAAPCDAACFPAQFGHLKSPPACFVTAAIDQDPFFRMTRDITPRLGVEKPAILHTKFLPSLLSVDSKMSSSSKDAHKSVLFLDETPAQIKTKINKFAFSGGRQTKEEHERLGGVCEKDVALQLLTYFLEDDEELARIRTEYASGRMFSGQLKALAIQLVQERVERHVQARQQVTPQTLQAFMTRKPFFVR